jgi:hypothetical protein
MKDNGHHATFTDARDRSWPYFENALSVHADLIFAQGGITAIQALIVMVSLRQEYQRIRPNFSGAYRLAIRKHTETSLLSIC